MDSEEQATRYEAQINIMQNIKKNFEWEMTIILAEEGLSGTVTCKHGRFSHMSENEWLENKYGHYQVHQTLCAEHAGLPVIYWAVKRQEYPRAFEEENINPKGG